VDAAPRTLAAFAARDAFGRLASRIAARSGMAGEAEDALAEALAAALAQWPRDGVPANPEGWLVTVARRRIADAARRSARAARSENHLSLIAAELEEARMADRDLPDKRLELMFVCTHPAIDRGVQAPLMLQTVLGLTAAEIADAFLVAPNTMGVRLSRAKTKIREAGIGFCVPAPEDRPARVAALLEAIYVAFTRGVVARDAAASERRGEALWLARLVAGLMPAEAEAQGLLALVAHVAARHGAGRAAGRYVPLDAQDPALWDGALIGCDPSMPRSIPRSWRWPTRPTTAPCGRRCRIVPA
jgi:RNA polymerase sigma-70 factor (ECF subfamily)